MKEVLCWAFTSSDEEEDEGVDRITRCISWESEKLRKVKCHLDKTWLTKVASVKQKRLCTATKRGQVVSERQCPPNAPKWTLKN